MCAAEWSARNRAVPLSNNTEGTNDMTITSAEAHDFAAWLRERMQHCGFPTDGPRAGGIVALAESSGVSAPSISRIFNSGYSPSLDTLRALAPTLRVSLKEILIRSGRVTPAELPGIDEARMPGNRCVVPDGFEPAHLVHLFSDPADGGRRRSTLRADAVRFEEGWLKVSVAGRVTAYAAARVADVELSQ